MKIFNLQDYGSDVHIDLEENQLVGYIYYDLSFDETVIVINRNAFETVEGQWYRITIELEE